MLDTFGMVVTAFSIMDKTNQVRFFEKTFVVANISLEVVLGMSFLILSNADVDFSGQELWWRTYTIKEALPITRRVDLVGKKKFTAAVLHPESETFVVYITSLSFNASPSSFLLEFNIHPFCRSQISGLIAKEASTKVPAEYSDFVDVFSPELASKLSEHIRINDYAIKLVDGQQPPYEPIYSLGPIELKTLKGYIETNLANRFIRPSKSLASAPILFDRKSDGSL